MIVPRDDYVDLCAGYVLGALSTEERERLEGRLASGDPLCEATLVEMHAGALLLAATVPPVTPRSEIEERVMAALDEIDDAAARAAAELEPPEAPTPEPSILELLAPEPPEPEPTAAQLPPVEPPEAEPPLTEPHVAQPPVTESPLTEPPVTEPAVAEPPVTEPPEAAELLSPSVRDRTEEVRALRGDRSGSAAALWAFVLAAIAIVAALAGWTTSQTARSDLQVAEARLGEIESELTSARTQLEDEGRWVRMTGAKDVSIVSMKPTLTAASPASARAFFDPSTGLAVVHLHDVPRVSDHSFEVWVIGDEGSTSIGLLDPDHAGYDVVRASLGVGLCVRSIAVSMEPEGGSPDPTGPSGPIVMLGRVGD